MYLAEIGVLTAGPQHRIFRAVTTAGAIEQLQEPASETDDGRMFCYRHPDRETWLRCGRCDQPICTKCSVMGPVGARCRVCGLRPNDGIKAFTPRQLVLGTGVTFGAGLLLGAAGTQLGVFAIIGGFFVGGFAAELFNRVVGYKRGPVMLTMLFGGIILGTVVGMLIGFLWFAGWIPDTEGYSYATYWVTSELPAALVSAGAACVGAYSRFR